jgi:hypothetical protein
MFKIGDRVRITDNGPHFVRGKTATIRGEAYGGYHWRVEVDGRQQPIPVFEREIESLNPPPAVPNVGAAKRVVFRRRAVRKPIVLNGVPGTFEVEKIFLHKDGSEEAFASFTDAEARDVRDALTRAIEGR